MKPKKTSKKNVFCLKQLRFFLLTSLRLRPELSPKFLSTLSSNPARTRLEKPGPTYNSGTQKIKYWISAPQNVKNIIIKKKIGYLGRSGKSCSRKQSTGPKNGLFMVYLLPINCHPQPLTVPWQSCGQAPFTHPTAIQFSGSPAVVACQNNCCILQPAHVNCSQPGKVLC